MCVQGIKKYSWALKCRIFKKIYKVFKTIEFKIQTRREVTSAIETVALRQAFSCTLQMIHNGKWKSIIGESAQDRNLDENSE